MSRTHKYTWEKRQIDIPDVHSRDYNKKPVVNLKGHQSSGAWAPELWCPLIFLGISWWCTHIYAGSVLKKKTRKCQEHINTLWCPPCNWLIKIMLAQIYERTFMKTLLSRIWDTFLIRWSNQTNVSQSFLQKVTKSCHHFEPGCFPIQASLLNNRLKQICLKISPP